MNPDALPRAPRILVVRLGAIGDALRVLPAVRRLRTARPSATIAWAVEDWVYPILAGNPNVDRFHVLRRRPRGGAVGLGMEFWRFLHEIRTQHYEIALDFHGRLKSGAVSWLSGAPRRVGFARGDSTEQNHRFTNIHVHLADRFENRVLRFLHLLEPLGISAAFDPSDAGLFLPEAVRARGRAWYDRAGRPDVAVFPGTSRNQAEYHRWPAEKWSDLLCRFADHGITAVVFWGPDDRDFAEQIVVGAGGPTPLGPRTTLPEIMAMLACFKAFIGANTAAMHMAWLQGVPTAFFSGPALPRTDAPLPPVPSRVLRAGDHVRAGISKRRQAEAVTAVSVAEAFEAVQALLAGRATVELAPERRHQ